MMEHPLRRTLVLDIDTKQGGVESYELRIMSDERKKW